MFRQVRFECGACGEGFVDWHDEDWQRSPVFCVHCGAPIVARAALEPQVADQTLPDQPSRPDRALGVLKADGEGFRDTLPGLTEEPALASSEALDTSRDRDTEPTLPRARVQGPSAATSNAPNAPNARVTSTSLWQREGRTLAPIAALLLGFAAGVPVALLAENPLLRLMNPAAYLSLQLSERLAGVSSAIDDGDWDRARALLDRARAPSGDSRLATLRARLTLGLILANRAAEAGREMAAVIQSPSVHPSAADLQRVYDALFPIKSSAATTHASASPAASAPVAQAKPTVSKRELLSFARDRQHRVQLDAAERLYGEVLRMHPNDAEARCGLAEVQILRGGVDDGAKLFEHALTDNASYVPAWVGLADVDWLRGHPERAACRYQAVIERFPASSYPPYIAKRVAQVMSSGVSPPQARTDVDAARACGE